jgi:hypothetical protein
LRAANAAIRQRPLWEHLIRDDDDFRRHLEHCTINAVKHGLVTRVCDWPHSSFNRDVRADAGRRNAPRSFAPSGLLP